MTCSHRALIMVHFMFAYPLKYHVNTAEQASNGDLMPQTNRYACSPREVILLHEL